MAAAIIAVAAAGAPAAAKHGCEWVLAAAQEGHAKKAAQDFKFHATLKPRLDNEIEDWHASQPIDSPRSVIKHHDDEDTTGLGRSFSIHYEWNHESKTDSSD